ncbi:MAG TPA: cytochrome c [Chthoniobacteraceae bacterium]|jgi:mono/diheme cytochrome c family protein|nr:cytochrome c [Chthoniobacteraceae bacterium]
MNENPEDLRTAGLHRGPNHVDYRETADLTNVHAAVQREHSVGTPGAVPMPIWLMVLCGVAVFWAGTSFSGGFGASYFSADNYSVHPGEEIGGGPSGGAGGAAAPPESMVDLGQTFFQQNCQVCHQATGSGLPGQFPPLAGSEFINGGTSRLGMILLKGLQGPVTVEGKNFNGAMPAWQSLPDKKIAAILTYVRQAFGNHAGPVAPEQIAAARKEFAGHPASWAFSDILAMPSTKELPGGAPAAPPAGSPAPAPAPAVGGAK